MHFKLKKNTKIKRISDFKINQEINFFIEQYDNITILNKP